MKLIIVGWTVAAIFGTLVTLGLFSLLGFTGPIATAVIIAFFWF